MFVVGSTAADILVVFVADDDNVVALVVVTFTAVAADVVFVAINLVVCHKQVL